MKKKIAFAVIAVIGALCMALIGCSGKKGGDGGVKLKDFADVTVEAVYGDNFSLVEYLSAVDEDGNVYGVSAELKDNAGNAVECLNNEFEITDKTGYTVLLSALNANDGSVIKTRTLTIVTVDSASPYINLGTVAPNATVGDDITVAMTFDSRTEDYTTSVSVKRLGYNSVTQDFDEALADDVQTDYVSKHTSVSFNVNKSGRYKISVNAWNGTEKTENTSVREKAAYIDVISVPYASEIESFDTAASKKAAYGANKATQNETAVWHESFNGRSGVLELKHARWYAGEKKSDDNTKWVYRPKHEYLIKSSFRDETFYSDNDNWDYISVHMFVAGESGEKVTVSCSKYETEPKEINCNEWTEYRISKKSALFLSEGGERNQATLASWLSADGKKCGANSLIAIVSESETPARKIYLDGIFYESDMKISHSVGSDGTVIVSASAGTETDGFEFSVKKPNSADFTKLDGNTFKADISGTYVLTASKVINGYLRTESTNVVIAEPNEIESFGSAESVSAAYGDKTLGNVNKKTQNATAVWHESFQGRNGVLELGPSAWFAGERKSGSTTEWQYTPKHAYHIKSSFRDETFYSDNGEWDYISVRIYVAGEQNERVKVSCGNYLAQTELKCNEWTEFRITKQNALFNAGTNTGNRTQETLAWYLSNNGLYQVGSQTKCSTNPLIAIEAESETPARKIYLDKISYEREISINAASATTGGGVEMGAEITLSASVPATEGNITTGFEFSVKKPSGENIGTLTDGNKFTPDSEGAYTITASITLGGVKYSESKIVSVVGANVIEDFGSPDSKIAAYRYQHKNQVNDTAVWHESFNGRNGVLQMSKSYSESTSGFGYNLKSSFRNSDYYKDNSEWTHISIWIYVAGDTNEKVNISSRGSVWLTKKIEINCNEWIELKITKVDAQNTAKLTGYSGSDEAEALCNLFSKDATNCTQHSLLALSKDKTIYLDKISYITEPTA